MPPKIVIILAFFFSTSFCCGQAVVVVDAGHGGKSPGAVSGRIYEKDINLDIALLVEKRVKALDKSIKVIQTRTTDKDVTLYERADIANRNKADLFVSIHTNANPSKSVSGTETFVMGVHKSGANLSVAMTENSVITLEEDYQQRYEGYDPKSAESFIIFSLMQYAYLEQSLDIATMVQNRYSKVTGLKNRGVKQDGFLVLWRTTMPSILTEVGFISNDVDRSYLVSDKGKSEIADALAESIVEFISSSGRKNDNSNIIEIEPEKKTGNSTEKSNGKSNPKPLVTSTPKDQKEETETPQTYTEKSDDITFYSVQVKTSTKKLEINPNNFGHYVSVVSEYYTQNLYKYAIGKLFSYKEALTLQGRLKEKYNDCFVVAYRNGRRITIKEAQQIIGK